MPGRGKARPDVRKLRSRKRQFEREQRDSAEPLSRKKAASTPVTDHEDVEIVSLCGDGESSDLSGNLQITASKTVNGMPLPAQNQSTVQDNDALEYIYTGTMGNTTTALIEWYSLDHSTHMFVNFIPSGVGDSVDNGQISTNVCPYSLTSTLRYRVTDNDRNYIVFRCQVNTQQSNGEIQTTYSHQYSFRPPSFVTSGSPSLLCSLTTLATVALSSIRAAMLVT